MEIDTDLDLYRRERMLCIDQELLNAHREAKDKHNDLKLDFEQSQARLQLEIAKTEANLSDRKTQLQALETTNAKELKALEAVLHNTVKAKDDLIVQLNTTIDKLLGKIPEVKLDKASFNVDVTCAKA